MSGMRQWPQIQLGVMVGICNMSWDILANGRCILIPFSQYNDASANPDNIASSRPGHRADKFLK